MSGGWFCVSKFRGGLALLLQQRPLRVAFALQHAKAVHGCGGRRAHSVRNPIELTLCHFKVLGKAGITLCEGGGDGVLVAVKHVQLPDKFNAEQCGSILQV